MNERTQRMILAYGFALMAAGGALIYPTRIGVFLFPALMSVGWFVLAAAAEITGKDK